MIVVEDYGEKFKRTYSNEGYYILKVGTTEKYVDAIDLKTSDFEYTETDEKIEEEQTNAD
jgi:hypothetical protein